MKNFDKKSKRSAPTRDYNEYLSSESPFAPFVSRIRPLIKIGSRDYNQLKDIARSINGALTQTDKVSFSMTLFLSYKEWKF